MRTLVLLTLLTLLLTALSLRSGSEPPAPAPARAEAVPHGFRPLLHDLGDPDPSVRGRARAVLVEWGEPSVILLAHCLNADDDLTRQEASAALVEIAPRLRPHALRAFAPLLVPRLTRGVLDPDPVVSQNSSEALRWFRLRAPRRPAAAGS
jgi:HEAT repeat protein